MDRRIRLLIVVYLALFIFGVASTATVTGPVMPLYVNSLGVGVVGWSILAAIMSLGMFVAEWVWGNLSDSFDRRLLMLMSAVSLGMLSLLYTIPQLVSIFALLMFSTGILIVAIGPLTRSYVSTESPRRSIGLYTSLWWASVVLGRVVGPLLGAYIAQTWAFTYSFLATSLAAFVLLSYSHFSRVKVANEGT